MITLTPASPLKASTKAQDIYGRLFAMATELGPNAKLPTVQQLRQELQVSITTLDTVLKQLESQSIIFRRQGSGIFVSPRLHQKCVGLVCEPAFFRPGMSPFWHELIEGARSRASQSGEAFRFYLALPSSDGVSPVSDDLSDDIAAGRIQGVLFLGNDEAAQEWLEERQIPSVVFAGRGKFRVEIAGEQLIALGVQHLLEQGCERLALFSHWEVQVHPIAQSIDKKDTQAFRRFLGEAGLPFFPELIWDARAMENRATPVPEFHQEQGYQGVMNLFSGSHPTPDGLLSTDDMMTRGILDALRELGLQPGQDVQIVSHINRGSKILNGAAQNIALIEVDPTEIVANMFAQLEILMDNKVPARSCIEIQANFRK